MTSTETKRGKTPIGEHDLRLPPDSWAASPGRRRNMQANRNRDTKPELRIRSLVHAAGLRFRVAARPLPAIRRSADLVFRPARVAVFCDGCFWHLCELHSAVPNRNREYWTAKLERNAERDCDTDKLLVEAGWLSIRIWEHDYPVEAAQRVIQAVTLRRPAQGSRSGRGAPKAPPPGGGSRRTR